MARRDGGRDQRPRPTCYVAAPAGISVGAVVDVLRQRDIVPIVPSQSMAGSGSLLDDMGEAISRADLFIAVLTRDRPNGNVFFELGYAHALRKRLLIVSPPGSEVLPPSLMGLLQVTADLENHEAIRFAVDQILASADHPKRSRKPSASRSRPISSDLAKELVARLDHAPSEKTLEDVVVSAITASGISVIVRSELAHQATVSDLGIWSDELDSPVGNPLLIEVKVRLRDREEVMQVCSQVQRYLQAANVRTALVLYLDGPEDTADVVALSLPTVLFMPVRELLEQLQRKGFGEVIRELRKRVAHRVAA